MSRIQRLLLASSDTSTDGCIIEGSLGETVSHHDSDEAFNHVYYVMVFMACLWFVGKIFQKIGMPALVGEIVTGIVLGPNLLNIVGDHGSDFLIIIGEIGLIMLVVEAGIDVDIGMLKLIGPRGLGIAILGSFIPLGIGLGISLAMGQSIQSSIAIGSCFAPTSMGIALNVLKKAHILNTPTGQLIIAAAILDDVIALIILSELTAMGDPTPSNIILPLVVSPVLILVVGYLSIRFIPKFIKNIMAKIPKQHHENSILGLLFAATFLLIPACHAAGSSHLLGAFLSGLMFCTDHTIHHVWSHQIKRILYWMLRVFFACTIGFAIPIKEFGSIQVIKRGLIYCISAIGKIVTGFFGRPLNKKEFLTIGFSMSAWGEFAFIIATASYEEGTIDKESFSAVLLAVLLSVIISPYCLRLTLSHYEKQMEKRMDKNLKKYGDTNVHPVYFAINTKARGKWGHQDKILHRIFNLNLEIIDFRSWHAPEYNYSHHQPLTKESFYVMDQNLALPPTKHITLENKLKLKDRVKEIRHTLKEALGEKAIINIKRWLPGVLKDEDNVDKKDAFFGQHVLKNPRRPSYCRREAFKQAHSIMSSFDFDYQKELERAQKKKAKKSSLFGENPTLIEINSNSRNPNSPASPNNGHNGQTRYRQHSNTLPEKPSAMKAAQSTPSAIPSAIAKKLPAKVHFHRIQLVRHLSQPEQYIGHSGAGHGGQAKGVGALPFTNKMINIHDHFEEEGNEEDEERSPSPRDQNDEDSTSYIYGDEDGDHHKLPQYQTPTKNLRDKTKFHHYIQKPMPIQEASENLSSHDHHTPRETPRYSHDDIEIVQMKNSHSNNGQDGLDVHGNPMIDMDSSDAEEDGDERQHEHVGSIAITVTSMDDDRVDDNYDTLNSSYNTDLHHLSHQSLHGTYVDSKVSVKSRSATLEDHHE